jgi:hypothetical protein
MAKGWIVLGFAAGYLAGSAAGRKQFERIKSTAQGVWERPEVQRTVKKVDEFVGDKAPAVHDVGAAVVDSVGDNASASDDNPGSPTPAGATS